MIMFVGRLTKDATVSTLKDKRQVVNFDLAINDYYKPKGSNEGVKTTTYISCSYWLSTKIATQLIKGNVVQVSGRLYVTAYTSLQNGEAKGTIQCHVNSIKIHQYAKEKTIAVKGQEQVIIDVSDDLPF